MGLDTSFKIIIDDKRYFIDFTDEKQKEEHRYFKECELYYNEKSGTKMNYWYPDDLSYSHPKNN